tara:strand:+ start:157 stop:354 length:198 start_codon:yes stop_codon:yes gene_type:complete
MLKNSQGDWGFDTFDIGEGLTSDKYYIHCMGCDKTVNRFYVQAGVCLVCKNCKKGIIHIIKYAGD